MNRIATETVLQDWRYGQVQAERLCAELLYLGGYQLVDPQCPLGGPDGLKDVLGLLSICRLSILQAALQYKL